MIVVISPYIAGPVSERMSVSVSEEPTKLLEPSVLYPHVFIAKGAGETLPEVGKTSPRLSMSVLGSERR